MPERSLKDGEGKYQTVAATMNDVQAAYDVGFGGGCEYEWPYE